MKKVLTLLALFILGFSSLTDLRAAPPQTCDQILTAAKARALAEHKAIFLHFGASWCGWCGKLEAFLDRPDVKPVFEKYFVPTAMVVQEEDEKEKLNTPGAVELLRKLGGEDQGIPFFAFLDSHAAAIVNCRPNGTGRSIGYPAEPAEVEWFLEMVRKAAPQISTQELALLGSGLRITLKPAKP
jgi:thioredoxin-related protein